MNIIFDIGANSGDQTLKFSNDPNNFIYAFEPTPELLYSILFPLQFSCLHKNVRIIPCAVSDYNGFGVFNVAGQYDWGCSSLNNFNDNLNSTWPGRNDFKKTNEIIVPVLRLDLFIEKLKIEKIKYFHCDVQGSDFKVLRSLGRYINIIESGVVETYNKNPLYKESDNEINAVKNYLIEHGFKNFEQHSNDCFDNEINLYFSK